MLDWKNQCMHVYTKRDYGDHRWCELPPNHTLAPGFPHGLKRKDPTWQWVDTDPDQWQESWRSTDQHLGYGAFWLFSIEP